MKVSIEYVLGDISEQQEFDSLYALRYSLAKMLTNLYTVPSTDEESLRELIDKFEKASNIQIKLNV